jgi:hypothetical protein
VNTSIIKAVPSGDFEEISIHMHEWETRFMTLVREGKRIKYSKHSMPNIPKDIQNELGRMGYCDLIVEQDHWQHFLEIPPAAPNAN